MLCREAVYEAPAARRADELPRPRRRPAGVEDVRVCLEAKGGLGLAREKVELIVWLCTQRPWCSRRTTLPTSAEWRALWWLLSLEHVCKGASPRAQRSRVPWHAGTPKAAGSRLLHA